MIPALYVHVPWCIQKCPYCDFNSHQKKSELPEIGYVKALLEDLKTDLAFHPSPSLSSIFIGGGTPSLFSAQAFDVLLNGLNRIFNLPAAIEITLEANPSTVEQQRFNQYRKLGINRLSLGIQSFNQRHLKKLGRIHNDLESHRAIECARQAGFDNINLDLMHGLPDQSLEEGLADLQAALNHQPEHLSWYQLTIEPNTVFYKQRPILPNEDDAFALEEAGLALLTTNHFERYEISAFTRNDQPALHNLNYWWFGDYYGIGAGAHGKLTKESPHGKQIIRTRKQRQPHDYLNPDKQFLAAREAVSAENVRFEFMLNTTRLEQPIPYALFSERTGMDLQTFMPYLKIAEQKKLITLDQLHWQITGLGRRFTNDLQALFLPD